MWQRLAKKLMVHDPKGKPFRRNSLEELDEFEQLHGIRFPKSYRAFATEIGAGLFCGYFRIETPDFGLEEGLQTRGLDLFKDIYGAPEFIDRMVPFGSTIAGDVIVWDPDDVTSPRSKEYGIHVLDRHSSNIVRLCSDFKSFINDCCFGHEFMIALGGEVDPEWEIMFTMHRFRPNRRKKRYQLP